MTAMTVVSQIWHRALTTQASPSRSVVFGAGIVALVLVVSPRLWRRVRYFVTIAHEAAHGLVAVASGRRLRGVRFHADTSGLTLSRGRTSGPGMFATLAAGYIGPAFLGLGAAYALRTHHSVGLLWSVLVVLLLLLVMVRNWFGLWLVLLAAAGVFAVSWWASVAVQSACAFAGAWFLLLAAPRPVFELQAARRRGTAPDSDADTLARLTGVPGLVWVGVFLLIALASLVVGGAWLVGAVSR
jgi:Peptidase M50B-like